MGLWIEFRATSSMLRVKHSNDEPVSPESSLDKTDVLLRLFCSHVYSTVKTEDLNFVPQIINRICKNSCLTVLFSCWFCYFCSALQASVRMVVLKPSLRGRNTETQESAWKYRCQHRYTELIMESHGWKTDFFLSSFHLKNRELIFLVAARVPVENSWKTVVFFNSCWNSCVCIFCVVLKSCSTECWKTPELHLS